jgi:predicted amidohydrolase
MTALRVACVQLCSGDEVAANIEAASKLIRRAKADGAYFVATPEMTSLMDIRPGALNKKTRPEAEDQALAAFRALAEDLAIWLLIGSLPIRIGPDTCANRSFLISPSGAVAARYDKIHMFDVEVGDGQSYRESKKFASGERAVVADIPVPGGGIESARLGLSICYDARFPQLYRALAKAGAEILMVPSAFTRVTGEAHWQVLLRARAIENGAFVMAPAQGGLHRDGRETFGHSLIVGPWGEILAEAATEPTVITASLDLSAVEEARRRIPALGHDRSFRPPDLAGKG